LSDEPPKDEPWSIGLERRADKDMERLDKPIRQRVVSALDKRGRNVLRPSGHGRHETSGPA
jgi:mRNA-degrading endonuclease RelE of RelBE toxin-antitoxin system